VLFWLEFRFALWIAIVAAVTVAAYAYYLRRAQRHVQPGSV